MKLEKGKFYRTRNGKNVYEIVKTGLHEDKNGRSCLGVLVLRHDWGVFSFVADGRATNYDELADPADLVEEVPDPSIKREPMKAWVHLATGQIVFAFDDEDFGEKTMFFIRAPWLDEPENEND